MNRRPSLIPPWIQKAANFVTPSKVYKNRQDELVPVPKIVVHPPVQEKKSLSSRENSVKDSINSSDSNDHEKHKKKKREYALCITTKHLWLFIINTIYANFTRYK